MPAEVKLAVAADDGGANVPVYAAGTSPAAGELKGLGYLAGTKQLVFGYDNDVTEYGGDGGANLLPETDPTVLNVLKLFRNLTGTPSASILNNGETLAVLGNIADMFLKIYSSSDTGSGPSLLIGRSSGTVETPTANADGKALAQIAFQTHDGTTRGSGASIQAFTVGATTPSNRAVGFNIWMCSPNSTTQTRKISFRPEGGIGIGVFDANVTSALHLKAGIATAGGSSFKINPGVKLTTSEVHAWEYDGDELNLTLTDGVRRQINVSNAVTVESAITVTASPFTYTNSSKFFEEIEVDANCTKIERQHLSGGAFRDRRVNPSQPTELLLAPGDSIRITYSGTTPVVYKVPR